MEVISKQKKTERKSTKSNLNIRDHLRELFNLLRILYAKENSCGYKIINLVTTIPYIITAMQGG